MVEIESINDQTGTVKFTDGSTVSRADFIKKFVSFFNNRIAGETLIPTDMEHFMRRTSGKNLSQLMKGKKMEGYLEGSMDKMLTPQQKIAIVSIAIAGFIGVIAFVILSNQGLLPF